MWRGKLPCLWSLRRGGAAVTSMGSTLFLPSGMTFRGHTDATSSSSLPDPKTILAEDDYKLVPRRHGTGTTGSVIFKSKLSTQPVQEDTVAATTTTTTSTATEGFEKHHQPTPAAPRTAGYAPWEISALLLPLIPVGGTTIPIRDVVHLLPSAAREEMQREGTPLAYVQRHLSDSVVVVGNTLSRRTVVSNAEGAATISRGNKIQKGMEPPPPPVTAVRTPARAGPRGVTGVPRTSLEVLDAMVEFIPTFFVNHQIVANQLPSEISKLYADSSFLFYIRRLRHYIDVRAHHGNTEIRLRHEFTHPKRGVADALYMGGLNSTDMMSQLARGRRPPRNSEANLIHFVVPRMPKAYTPIATVLQDVSDIVSRHPSFDPRLGVTGLFEKYPEYFQIVDSRLRVRPFRSAPNSLDDLNATTSPIPLVYAKVKQLIDTYAEGKDYNVEEEKAAAAVPTGKLYALLSDAEKLEVKGKCRSFPRFLRLHGDEIVVSVDNMKVYQFRPTYERCAETIVDQRLTMSSLSPDDPVLKIPAAMDDSTAADWAVRELYDALPLMQCAELDEVMSLVPPSVKNALPQEKEKMVEHLALYPDYFTTWPYPDDPSVIVVQRAKLESLPIEQDDIARMVIPLIPQGGLEASRLLRRVPLPLQRYFYHHGMKKVLGEMKRYFLVVGDKVMRVG